MKKILDFYGFSSIEEASKEMGFFNTVDTINALTEMYEDDTAPFANDLPDFNSPEAFFCEPD
jgi:hypothetical protein